MSLKDVAAGVLSTLSESVGGLSFLVRPSPSFLLVLVLLDFVFGFGGFFGLLRCG